MASYAIKRLFWTLPVLFFIALITFVLMHLVPGGPWDASGRPVSETLEAQLRVKYGLDQPLTEQFGTYMWNLLQGDLGISFSLQGRAVTSILFEGWPPREHWNAPRRRLVSWRSFSRLPLGFHWACWQL